MISRLPALDAPGSGWASAACGEGPGVGAAGAGRNRALTLPEAGNGLPGERGRARTGLGSVSDDASYRAMDWLLRSASRWDQNSVTR